MYYKNSLIKFIEKALPSGAILIPSKRNDYNYMIDKGDIDGDGIDEIAVGYMLYAKPYVKIFKQHYNCIYNLAEIKGDGNTISGLSFEESSNNKKDLIIKWKMGEDKSKMSRATLCGNRLKIKDELIDEPIYSKTYLYPASLSTIEGSKWGYIDGSGEFIISPIYDWAEEFQDNDLAAVTRDNLVGMMNKYGEWVIGPKYDSIRQYNESRAVATKDQKYLLIDEEGNEIFISNGFIQDMKENRVVITTTNENYETLYGYIDKNGNEIIHPKFKMAYDFHDGRTVVQLEDNKFAIIDIYGNVLNSFDYAYVGDLRDGLLSFREKEDGELGYIDEEGNVVISPKYRQGEKFRNNRAVVFIGEDYEAGLIDSSGNYILEPKYEDIRYLEEDRYAVVKANVVEKPYLGFKYAIVDTNGNFLKDFIFTQITSYADGVASVSDGSESYFIDKEIEKVESLPVVKGESILSIIGELVRAQTDNRLYYLDMSGNVVWKESSGLRLNDKYRILENKYKPKTDYIVYYPQMDGMDNEQAQNDINKELKDILTLENNHDSPEYEYSYSGDFTVVYFNKDLVVINLEGYLYPLGAAHGMPFKNTVHIDLSKGEMYNLEDLFKEDSNYVEVISEIIKTQITESEKYDGIWLESYNGIDNDQSFFINNKGLNIYFSPYEIAPYAAGFPTFTITFDEINNIIDIDGDFWNSFN